MSDLLRPPPMAKNSSRKIKTHTKSRRGCGNCKLRRVKCDENRPQCDKCIAFGVLCNYRVPSSALQSTADGASTPLILQRVPLSTNRTIVGALQTRISSPSQAGGYQIKAADLGILHKFQERTAFTITMGTPLQTYRTQAIPLAFRYPYLLHAILALTLTHDRHLSLSSSSSSQTTPTAPEAFHLQHALTTFNRTLSTASSPSQSRPISHSERTAMWGTSAFLGVLAFTYFDASDYTEAWPLAAPSALDLNWMCLSEGKKEIMKIAKPPAELGAEALFRVTPVVDDELAYYGASLPRGLIELCELVDSSGRGRKKQEVGNEEENPYRHAVLALAGAMREEEYAGIIVAFWKFVCHIRPGFKRLLAAREERALLVLAWWYGKLCQVKDWWLLRRARVEGRAICVFLEGRWRGKKGKEGEPLLELLIWPRGQIG